jgi:glucose/arabinose dehydrogenase
MRRVHSLYVAMLITGIASCAHDARVPVADGFGPSPVLPPPEKSLVPVVHIAPAKGWPAGAKPKVAQGLAVTRFAEALDHPRWVYVLPNGDVLVAETAAPPRPEDGKGVKGAVMKLLMKKAGSAVPSANRITLLRDVDGDGVAEVRSTFLEGLNSPFGMTLVGNDFSARQGLPALGQR